MNFKGIRNDMEVKPIWRNGMNVVWYAMMLLFILRLLVSMRDRANGQGYSSLLISLNWILLVGFSIYLIPAIMYLIKPSLFRMNKEQGVQGIDETR